jgi:hypothetical protein
MNVDDEAEIVQVHLCEGLVSNDTRIRDEYIHPAPSRFRGLHHGLHRFEVRHGILRCQGFSTSQLDLFRHGVRAIAQIIHNHARAPFCEQQRVGSPKAGAGASDYGHSSRKVDHTRTPD